MLGFEDAYAAARRLAGPLLTLGDELAKHGYFDHGPDLTAAALSRSVRSGVCRTISMDGSPRSAEAEE